MRDLLELYPSVVAVADTGELVGFAFSSAMSPDIIELANLLVATPYRNHGLGAELVREFELAARSEYRTVILCNSELWSTLDDGKKSAVPLYERLGYRRLYETESSTVMVKEL